MGTINVTAERSVAAPSEQVFGYLADMREHHPKFLPPAFENFTVESGGVGKGTVVRFTVNAGGRSREYLMNVDEPEPGRVLTETDANSTLVTTFTVASESADTCTVKIHTSWQGAGGIGGIFERIFAPRVMSRIYDDELERLDSYAREQQMTG